MRRGYLLAATVFAVMFCLVLVGCPKKPVPQPGPMMPGPGMMPGSANGPGMNSEAPTENAEATENVENAEATDNAEPATENADAAAGDTKIPTPTKSGGG